MPTSKFCIRQFLLKTDARSLPEKNQQKFIDCLKPRSNKNDLECKKCGCNEFYVFSCQSFSFVMHCPVCNV